MIGPVERELRRRLTEGAMSRFEVRRQLGPIALWHFDKLVSIGALEADGDGAWKLKLYKLDASEVAARREAQERARRSRELVVQQEAERWKQQNLRRKAEEEQRALFEGLGTFPREERLSIVEERRAALAESRAWLAEQAAAHDDSNREPEMRLAQGA